MGKIGVLIPDRGDRPIFLKQAISLLSKQTIIPAFMEIVDDPPLSHDIDITYRYRLGCERLFKKGCDAVIFWESDDFYAENYLETMTREWLKSEKPDIFGIGNTTYYHVTGKYFKINHPERASAMSTMVTNKVLGISWPSDNYHYLDITLWQQLQGKTFIPSSPICLGIKHGIGMVGGGCHNSNSGHYTSFDKDGEYLKSITGSEFEFYYNLKSA